MADAWAEVLDDLDGRLLAAESGDIAALDGWSVPAQPAAGMTADEVSRASRILARQRALEDRLRGELVTTAASIAGMRSARTTNRWVADSAPVYVDRSA